MILAEVTSVLAVCWWSWKSRSGHRAGEEAVWPLLSTCGLGPLHEVSVCALVFPTSSGHSGHLHGCSSPKHQKSVSQENQAESVSSLCDLVLEVISRHFCCSHRVAQVEGGGNHIPPLLKARVPVGHTGKIL